jgi:hypothetical protein
LPVFSLWGVTVRWKAESLWATVLETVVQNWGTRSVLLSKKKLFPHATWLCYIESTCNLCL